MCACVRARVCVCVYVKTNKVINDISLYYFSNGSRNMKCTSLRLLKPQQPYKILHVQMDERLAILHLKEARNEEFLCSMFRDLILKFLKIIWMNNGEAAGLKLKFYGCSDAGKPIIRISGKRFVRYLV